MEQWAERSRRQVFFSIIVVSLNPGEKLQKTLESIFRQKYACFQVILKDGMSKDGSVEAAESQYAGENRLKIYRQPDKSIYDAMNQAIEKAEGEFFLFLNCGDTFSGDCVLGKTSEFIRALGESGGRPLLCYGDTYCERTGAAVHSAPAITGFTCYRNIPCHQSCFYQRELFQVKKYNTDYRIRADYDHFLWCFYLGGARMEYMNMTVASYEGGGYSESKENRARDRKEHRMIASEYMGRGELLAYRAVMLATLAPLRRFLAENRFLSGIYHRGKDALYRKAADGPRTGE